jgi:hypothetical protein
MSRQVTLNIGGGNCVCNHPSEALPRIPRQCGRTANDPHISTAGLAQLG